MTERYPSNVKAGLQQNKIVVLIIPDEEYSQKLLRISEEVNQAAESVLYVSLNRPYRTLLESFSLSAGITPSKFYFVDAVTQSAEGVKEPEDNVTFVSSPGSLTELSLAITKLLDSSKFDYVVFDSLSTLLVYEDEAVVTRFVHSLISKMRVVGCKAVFTSLKRDTNSNVIKDLNMFADMIIDTETWGV